MPPGMRPLPNCETSNLRIHRSDGAPVYWQGPVLWPCPGCPVRNTVIGRGVVLAMSDPKDRPRPLSEDADFRNAKTLAEKSGVDVAQMRSLLLLYGNDWTRIESAAKRLQGPTPRRVVRAEAEPLD